MSEIAFTLPFALPSLNVRDRQHWSKRRKLKQWMHLEVLLAIKCQRPSSPWRHVKVTVERCSSGCLDTDNCYGSFKPLGDVLKNIGIIEDDRSDWLTLEMKQSRAAPGEGQTIVRIEHVGSFGGAA